MLAFIASFGRVYYFYHYVGDVVGGCFLAYGSGFAVNAIYRDAISNIKPWHVYIAAPVFLAAMKLSKSIGPLNGKHS
jgi:hypothetical protein